MKKSESLRAESVTNTQSGWDELSMPPNKCPTELPQLDNNLWKSISESEEAREQLRQRLENYFEKNFHIIIGNLLYEGDQIIPVEDRRNADYYTYMTSLESIAGFKKQEKMVEEYCATGNITTATLEGAHKKLAEAISGSEFFSEFYTFSRRRHAEYLAGRLAFDRKMAPLNEVVLKSIWALDPHFFDSKEAKSLVSDSDYLHRTYGEKIEEELKSQDRTSMVTTQIYEKRLGAALRAKIEDGALTAEEILKDPFLRKRHAARLLNSSEKSDKTYPIIEKIWELDGTDFYDCELWKNYLTQFRDKNVGVFKDVSINEAKERVATMIEMLSDRDYAAILRAYNRNPRYGDHVLTRLLLPVLGLSGNPTKILYSISKDDVTAGYKVIATYKSDTNTIIYYQDKGESPFKRRPYSSEELLNRMGTIAHEIYHAHQTYGNNADPGLKALFEYNRKHYIKPRYNYGAYREQIREVYAFGFQEAFLERAKTLYDKKENKE